MAFAQITYRESLRDIEACLGAQPAKLCSMGLRGPVAKSTLADANELRDWRIWSDLAAVLIKRARKLYLKDDFGLDLANTVYALDSTTIDLCLSLFPWADFRSTKAAVKMHTLLDLRGPIPSFIHISDGKMGDAAALDLITPEASAIYVMDRGYVDFQRLLYVIHQAGAFFVTRTKVNANSTTASIPIRYPIQQLALAQTRVLLSMVFIPNKIILSTYGASRSRSRNRAASCVPDPATSHSPPP